MQIIKLFLGGIIAGFNTLIPVSYTGNRKIYSFLNESMVKTGNDNLLPVLIQLAVIISLIYYLRNDLIIILKTVIKIFSHIFKKSFSLKEKTREENNLYMLVLAVAVFILTPVFSSLFYSMSGNFVVISIGFLISGIFLYMTDNAKKRKLSEKNEVPLNAIPVGIFKIISLIPGISAIGGMYFAGVTNGFTKEFSLKFTYMVTLFATFISFVKNIIGLFYNFSAIYNIFGYILAFIGAFFLSGMAIHLTTSAVKKNHLKYFAFYNFLTAIFVFLIWLRG